MEDIGVLYAYLVYLLPFGLFFGHFGIFYGYIFGIFFTILVFCTKKNLAALHQIARAYKSSGRSGR
jgi:hypothetical protein